MCLALGDYGSLLLTGAYGRLISEDIQTRCITIDMSGVKVMTCAFAVGLIERVVASGGTVNTENSTAFKDRLVRRAITIVRNNYYSCRFC